MSKGDGSLDPTIKTFKRLFGLSGNRCAFPECTLPMVHGTGTVLGEACHIKGRRPNAARYDPEQSEDQRRAFDNLVLMCSSHNKVVDDPDNSHLYSVDILRSWKRDHEAGNLAHPYVAPPQAVEAIMADYRQERNMQELREMLSWHKRHKQKLETLLKWQGREHNLPAIRELQLIRDWFVREGPGSCQYPGRIPWQGVVGFEMEVTPPVTKDGLTFRAVNVKWKDGRLAVIELDESWFSEAHDIEISSQEAEAKVRKEFDHNHFNSLVYRDFERGVPYAQWYFKAARTASGTSISGSPGRPCRTSTPT